MAVALETHRFRLLLAALLALLVGEATGLGDLLGGVPIAAVGLAVVAAMLWVLRPQRRVFWTALVLALPTVSAIVLTPGGPEMAELAGSSAHAPFFCLAAVALATRVVRSQRADEETVVGSICAYLFIALAFASLYTALATWSPAAFQLGEPASGERLFDRLFYFSLVTLTTLGYGDIVPLNPLARSLVTLESVTGILFPAIVIARIVALYTSGGGRPFAARDADRRPGRFELLLGAQLLILFATPAIGERASARAVLGLLVTLLLLAALQAGSERRTTRAVGIGLAVCWFVTRWWPGFDPSWRQAALGFEAALLFLVSGSLFGWLLREPRVTRDVLLAAISLYGLLGFAWASAFALVERAAPGSLATSGGALTRTDLVYYSFMTLTTTGFGDIAPVSAIARRLAELEALLGILYPSVLVARLVALYRSD
jgi:voltage-gated potassium channel Kch